MAGFLIDLLLAVCGILISTLPFTAIFYSSWVNCCLCCCCKSKKKEAPPSRTVKRATTVVKSTKSETRSGSRKSKGKKIVPKTNLPENQDEIEAVRKIEDGKVRAAKDFETVEDAVSDWGAVKPMD